MYVVLKYKKLNIFEGTAVIERELSVLSRAPSREQLMDEQTGEQSSQDRGRKRKTRLEYKVVPRFGVSRPGVPRLGILRSWVSRLGVPRLGIPRLGVPRPGLPRKLFLVLYLNFVVMILNYIKTSYSKHQKARAHGLKPSL